jgi:steroid delta-isomerase-like uncharacterized protein
MAETQTETKQAKRPGRTRRTKRKVVEDTARGYFEAVESRDPEAMAGYWAADYVEDVSGVGVLRGPEAVKGYFRDLFAAIPDAEMSAQRLVANDSHAVVEWRLTGTFRGAPYQGIEPNGRHLELRGVDVIEVEGDKLASNSVYFDTGELARQIGMLPAPDSGAERAIKSAFNAVTKVRKAINERR